MLVHVIYKLAQVAAVMGFSPLVAGLIHRLKEVVQSKHGPSIFQPYRDISKLFHKDQVISEESSWIFLFTPYVVFVAPIFVTLLIPVLTNYPLFLAFIGDMLVCGFVLALAGDLFLLCTFSMVATRQVQDCIRFFFFIWQSIFFALSTFLLGLHPVV